MTWIYDASRKQGTLDCSLLPFFLSPDLPYFYFLPIFFFPFSSNSFLSCLLTFSTPPSFLVFLIHSCISFFLHMLSPYSPYVLPSHLLPFLPFTLMPSFRHPFSFHQSVCLSVFLPFSSFFVSSVRLNAFLPSPIFFLSVFSFFLPSFLLPSFRYTKTQEPITCSLGYSLLHDFARPVLHELIAEKHRPHAVSI